MFLNRDIVTKTFPLSRSHSNRSVPSDPLQCSGTIVALHIHSKKWTARSTSRISHSKLTLSVGGRISSYLFIYLFIFYFITLFILFYFYNKSRSLLGFNFEISFMFLFYGQFSQDYIYFNNPTVNLVMELRC